jgi:RHS repeat-associated protein
MEQRDLRERLEEVSDTALPPPAIGAYLYDAVDRPIMRTYANGAIATYSYNENNWTASIDHAIGATDIARFSYTYDHEGNALTREDIRDATQSETYLYDPVHRLVDFKRGTLAGSTIPAPAIDVQYDLDPVGNWNTHTVNSVPEARTHNVVNEITSIGASAVIYNAAGLLVEDALHTFEYDEAHRLVMATRKSDGTMLVYSYDALGRRVIKVIDPSGAPVEIRYFYDDQRVIEEQDSTAIPLATYVYGRYIDEPLTMDRGGQTYFYHQNNVWSTAALTDSGGAVAERYAYDAYGCPSITDGAGVAVPGNPWGVPHSDTANPYLFTGRQFDEETGLYDYRARSYDCMKGRFLQRDALGYIDGANLYEYAKSNPVKYVDANGQYSVAIPSTKGKNQITKSEFKWLIKELDWSRWGQWGGTWYGALPGRGTLQYNGTLDNAEKAWANIGLHGIVDPNNAKKFESVQLSPFVNGGTSGGGSWTNSNYNWTVQKTNIKSQPSVDKNGEECHIMTGNVSFIDGNAVTTSSSFEITGKGAVGGDKGAPGAEVSVGFTYSETVTVNVTRTSYSASFRQKICPCGAANSDLFDFRKFGPRLDRFGKKYPWYHEIDVRVENSEQNKPVSNAGMW